MEVFGVIYKVTNKENGKIYIGQTTYQKPKMRWDLHWTLAKSHARTEKSMPIFHRALLKYGPSAFCWKVIARAYSREQLDHLERMCIRLFKSLAGQNGYNIELGGNEGHEERIRQVGLLNGKEIILYGITYPSLAHAARELKLSETQVRYKIQHGFEGCYIKSEGQRPRDRGDRTPPRPVMVEGIQYPSLKEAERSTGVWVASIKDRIEMGDVGYYFVDQGPKPSRKHAPQHNGQHLMFEGQMFESIRALARYVTKDHKTVRKWIAKGDPRITFINREEIY